MVATYKVNDKGLKEIVKLAQRTVSDLTLPLTLISKNWFKSNQAFLKLKGPGRFTDLSEAYKIAKRKKYGSEYPILYASGQMLASITIPAHPDSINLIINKNKLIIGSKHRLAAYHQYGTNRLPERPFVIVGAESQDPDTTRGRWARMILSYVHSKLEQESKK